MEDTILILFSILAGHILYLSIALVLNHKHTGNFMLGIILVLLGLRVGKSVLTLIFPAEALWLSTVGLACMAALGPLIHHYCIQLFSITSERYKKLLIHFLPALLCCFALSWPVVNMAYYVITLHMLAYLIITTRQLYVNREVYRADNIRWRWSVGVMTASGVIWISFLAQIVMYTPFLYATVVGISVVLVYGLSLWASQQNNLFAGVSKKRSDASAAHYADLGSRIKNLLELDEIFIDPSLTITVLAKKLDVPPYVLSKCINAFFQKSFPELLTGYRIEKSKQLLLSSLNKTYSIEGIAYESGFSTLSAFYNAFKKICGVTPAQFRKNAEGKMHVA